MSSKCKIKSEPRSILSFDIGIKNLAYCLIGEEEKIKCWKVCDIGASTYETQSRKLINELDAIFEEWKEPREKESFTVVIERQPSRNPKMRVISGEVFMYFALLQKRPIFEWVDVQKVVYFSPKFKLRVYESHEDDEPIVEKTYKSAYTFRKNLAKQHCERIIKRTDNEWVEYFKASKKKDDLSDSMLQGLAYLRFA